MYIYIYTQEFRALFSSRALNSLIWMSKRVAHVGELCASVLGPRTRLLVIHFSTRVRVVISNKDHTEHLPQCLDASIPCLLKHNSS